MREGDAAEAVEVRRLDTGELLEDVFFQGRYELWDPERRRLTLLLDPGRIKRGLGPHEAMGYPLVEGTTVEVRVTDRFRDAEGRPLAAPASRRYRVAAPIREHVDPVRWRQLWPAAGASDPLEVRFDRPLDHAMLQHAVRVTDADGAPLPGRVEVAPEETVWRFHPENPWGAGPYSLVVEPMLEDLAGNSPIRVFDRDLERPEDAPPRPAAPIVMSRALAPAAGKVA